MSVRLRYRAAPIKRLAPAPHIPLTTPEVTELRTMPTLASAVTWA